MKAGAAAAEPTMSGTRRRNSGALLAVGLFAGTCAPAQAAIVGTCTIMIGNTGVMKANPSINIFGSKQAGGPSASAAITASSLLCTLPNLIDCYSVSTPATAALCPHRAAATPMSPSPPSSASTAPAWTYRAARRSG